MITVMNHAVGESAISLGTAWSLADMPRFGSVMPDSEQQRDGLGFGPGHNIPMICAPRSVPPDVGFAEAHAVSSVKIWNAYRGISMVELQSQTI